MADPRQTARAWLAETVRAIDPCGHVPMLACSRCVADAVLSADGVAVEMQRLARPTPTGFLGYEPTHERVVIRLPAQPIGEDQPDA